MRIIAGEAGGRKLKTRKTKSVRPTQDRIKEAIFSMLISYIKNSKVLDLFAGFGSLGLEAVSRGAYHTTFVEINKKNASIISENISLCNFEKYTNLVIDDVFSFLKNNKNKYDLIFMDPPYEKNLNDKVIKNILKLPSTIKDEGLIIVEHSKKEKVNGTDKLKVIKNRNYGNTTITILKYREE